MEIQVIGSGSSGNCYKVSDGSTTLLLDIGLPIRKIKEALNYSLTSINGALVTHEHLDHAKAAKDIAKSGVNVYMSSGTKEALSLSGHRIKIIKSKEKISIGTFIITAFDLIHDANEPLGFLLESTKTKEKLLYITDTMYCKYRFDGITHLMIEANFSYEIAKNNVIEDSLNASLAHRIYRNHMSIDTAIDFIKNNKKDLKEIYLLHLSNDNSNAEKFKEDVQKITGVLVTVC